jgi:hypothetical protein
VAGALGVAVLSAAAVGVSGVAAFLNLVAQSSTQFTPNSFVGFYGLSGVIFGPGAPAEMLWLAGATTARVLAFIARVAVRHDRRRLEIGLTVAALVTILSAPHVYVHDLVLLAPMFVWMMADARIRDQASLRRTRRTTVVVIACWLALSGVEALSLVGSVAAGAIMPEVLIALTALACVVTFRGSRRRVAPAAAGMLASAARDESD